MRIVITGAAGFLGSHLCDFFLEKQHEVIGVDNLLTGSAENLAHLEGSSRFQWVRQDVTDELRVEGPVDAVLHFASPASPCDYIRYPIQTLKVGALGTHKTLGLAKAKGSLYLLASTSEVYGDPEQHPQKETYWGHVNPVGPRGVYDEAKRFAEALATAYHKIHGVRTRIARIFNTYGPRMRVEDGRALPNFLIRALRGEDLLVHGSGRQTRSYCYVSDLVGGIYRLLMSDEAGPVNLGNDEEVAIHDLAREILVLTGSRSQIRFAPVSPDDPQRRKPDLSKAKDLLGWRPAVSRREGLLRTIEYYRQLIH